MRPRRTHREQIEDLEGSVERLWMALNSTRNPSANIAKKYRRLHARILHLRFLVERERENEKKSERV